MQTIPDPTFGYQERVLQWSPSPFSFRALIQAAWFFGLRVMLACIVAGVAASIHPYLGVAAVFLLFFYLRRRWAAARWLYRIAWLQQQLGVSKANLAKRMTDGLALLDAEETLADLRAALASKSRGFPSWSASRWESASEAAEDAFVEVSDLLKKNDGKIPDGRLAEVNKEIAALSVSVDRSRLVQEIKAAVLLELRQG